MFLSYVLLGLLTWMCIHVWKHSSCTSFLGEIILGVFFYIYFVVVLFCFKCKLIAFMLQPTCWLCFSENSFMRNNSWEFFLMNSFMFFHDSSPQSVQKLFLLLVNFFRAIMDHSCPSGLRYILQYLFYALCTQVMEEVLCPCHPPLKTQQGWHYRF